MRPSEAISRLRENDYVQQVKRGAWAITDKNMEYVRTKLDRWELPTFFHVLLWNKHLSYLRRTGNAIQFYDNLNEDAERYPAFQTFLDREINVALGQICNPDGLLIRLAKPSSQD